MNPTPTYDILQQVFSLNWLSNIAAFKTGTQQQLQDDAKAAISAVLTDPVVKGLIGEWTLVWGPVVYQFPGGNGKPASTVADNLMFVASNSNGGVTRYVVAVSATNPISWFGWMVEDTWITTTVPWAGAPGAVISAGASTGLNILLNMTSNGQTLSAFLGKVAQAAPAGPLDVVVSGHSLGGALSPLVALTLAEQQGLSGSWDPSRRAAVSAVPSAGFSPGNFQFARYYEQLLGLRTTRLWNRLDMVAASYELDSLHQVPYLYYPYIVPNVLVRAMCDLLVVMASVAGQPYVQLNRQTAPLAGQVDLGLAALQLNLPPGARSEFASRVVRAVGRKFNSPPQAGAALQSVIETVLAEFCARSGAGAAHPTPTVALQQAVASARQNLGGLTAQAAIPGVTDIVKEVEGMIVFYAQALIQHVMPYLELLGVKGFVDQMQKHAGAKPAPHRSTATILEVPGLGARGAAVKPA